MWFPGPLGGKTLPEKTIVLTFDDGPANIDARSNSSTFEIGQYLAGQGIRATFFLVGKQVMQQPETPRQLRLLGHLVGNHSFSHPHLTASALSDCQVAKEIEQTAAFLDENRANENSIPFRAPYGSWNPHLSHALNKRHDATASTHFGPIGWDIRSHDYECWRTGRSPEECATAYEQSVLKRKGKKGIMLFHDATADDRTVARRNRGPELIRLLIPRLQNLGFSFSCLSEVPEVKILRTQSKSWAGEF